VASGVHQPVMLGDDLDAAMEDGHMPPAGMDSTDFE
jgi:hypothetical protein